VPRGYHQHCGLARALDLVGERWTLLIVRNLMLGPRRYSDLLSELPGITTNLLAKRLREMQKTGLIARRTASPAAAQTYELAPLGATLGPAIGELARWGGQFMGQPRRDDTVNVGWGLLSLPRRYCGGVEGVVGLEAGEQRFELTFEQSSMRVVERPAVLPLLVVRGSAANVASWLVRGASALSLERAGKLQVNGNASVWRALAQAFVAAGSDSRPTKEAQ
jgi:DNA-binding HxlR family transcriptional regulator